MRKLSIATAVLTTVPLLVIAQSPAHAACEWDTANIYSQDFRKVWGSGCVQLGVRHAYDPPWSGNNYWTGWVYGTNSARTPSAAELYTGETYVNG